MSPFTETHGLDADDPILGLLAAFREDRRPQKVNLAIGTYKNDAGESWVLPSVMQAEEMLTNLRLDKDYLPIDGDPAFLSDVTQLLLGDALTREVESRTATVQTIGGTSALRLGADYLRLARQRHIYVSDPTWPNHPNLCEQARLHVGYYPYYNSATKSVRIDALLESLKSMPQGSALLLHVCCHNPTGIDFSPKEWQDLLDAMQKLSLFPFFDIAYQGLSVSLSEDAAPLRACVERGMECLIANSFSKNFGMYGERVGTLTAVCADPNIATRVRKQFKTLIRRTFSNPPLHGERIIKMILSSPSLRTQWEAELTIMRQRIRSMRALFLQKLQEGGRLFPFLENEQGLFSYGWLSPEQVQRLKQEFAIYLPNNGRLTISCLTHQNIDYVVNAVLALI